MEALLDDEVRAPSGAFVGTASVVEVSAIFS